VSTATKNWFDVDRRGLSKLIERRGKIWLLHELIANAWDADGATRVEVVLAPENGAPLVTVVVRDDAPDGFQDLSQSWTLFAESSRKADRQKRGRFCLGEKLVLALCDEASIVSTQSAVMFDARGRTSLRARRPRGTEFMGIARITRAELAEIREGLRRLISPPGITTVVDGVPLPSRLPLETIEATLATEVPDDEGVLRRTTRRTTVSVHEPLPGATGWIYEMGIPVVETGDRFDVNVGQKCPLSMERDNVTPGFLRDVRTIVVNAMRGRLNPEDAAKPLVNEALADPRATPETVARLLDLKFGEKRAIWDPLDPEANMNLTAQGYTLIKGAHLTGDQWANVKRHDRERTRPAGQVAPTKKALFAAGGKDSWVPRERWTPAMRAVVAYATRICRELVGGPVEVSILSDITESWVACYEARGLVFNLGRLGHRFFEEALDAAGRPRQPLNRLLIHELGHHFESNHLDEKYHEALCDLGARMTQLALARPELFQVAEEARPEGEG
jgi:hypothetical protein